MMYQAPNVYPHRRGTRSAFTLHPITPLATLPSPPSPCTLFATTTRRPTHPHPLDNAPPPAATFNLHC
jgi:hypothetical protein